MGRDRTTEMNIGNFTLSIDWDHKGSYRGSQAMEKGKYRGRHYHLDSLLYSQEEIMKLIEDHLEDLGAIQFQPDKLAIGIVEYKPKTLSAWKKGDDLTCILWISGFNGKLHVESNKLQTFTKSILKRKELIELIKTWNEREYFCGICDKFFRYIEGKAEYSINVKNPNWREFRTCPDCDKKRKMRNNDQLPFASRLGLDECF